MLAATIHTHQLDKIQYPVFVSPKIDGIRCLIHPELGPVTRSFKPVPNRWVRETLARWCNGCCLDGELVGVNEKGEELDFNDTQSAIMTQSGHPFFAYRVFDCFDVPSGGYENRLIDARCHVEIINQPWLQFVEHRIIWHEEQFKAVTQQHVALGYEGTMLRDPRGPYKSGRSTLTQGWLVKFKEWCDAEGQIIAFEELMHNANEDQRDNFGLAKRSSHKDNLIPMGTLGALVLATEWGELRVGSGFDAVLRADIWARNHCDLAPQDRVGSGESPDIGRVVTFKYQPFGMKDGGKPRFPIFLRFREQE